MNRNSDKKMDSPDTLQDLCIFYLMNNTDSIVTSLHTLNTASTDITSTFPLLIGNKLLEYYTRFCLPSEDDQKNFDKLMDTCQLFDEIDIIRADTFTAESVKKLAGACKALKRLNLTCVDGDAFFSNKYIGHKELLENNLPHLTSLSLSQKCEEATIMGLLNILCGKDYDEGVSSGGESEEVSNNSGGDDSDDGKVEHEDDSEQSEDSGARKSDDHDSLEDDREKTDSDRIRELILAKLKNGANKTLNDNGQIKDADGLETDTDDEAEMPETKKRAVDGKEQELKGEKTLDTGVQSTAVDADHEKMETTEVEKKSNTIISDLKAFSYNQFYTSAHPNLEPCRSFGWFYELLSGILNCNKNLQSFSLVTLISNPIEWFLSRPDLAQLKDLQALSLSLQYVEMYTADSEEMRYPKMPYNKDFFKNLPVLQQLRCFCSFSDIWTFHAISHMKSLMRKKEEGFAYEDRHVEMFREAIKEMPYLDSLDISGTNLSTILCHKNKEDEKCLDHCMPGFEGRQFDFLGLYGTHACKHKYIPARRVSGNASIEQLLEALRTLQHNLLIIPSVISDIHRWINKKDVDSNTAAMVIDGLLSYLSRLGEWSGTYNEATTFEENTVSSALDSIEYLIRNDHTKMCMTIKRKRVLLEQLLVVCNNVNEEGGWESGNKNQRIKIYTITMQLINDQKLQHVAAYSYRLKQYIKVLVRMFHPRIEFSNLILCSGLIHKVCSKYPEYRVEAGTRFELVKKALGMIEDSWKGSITHTDRLCWELLRMLTDETPQNCEAFVQNNGCETSIKWIKCDVQKYLLCQVVAILAKVAMNPSVTEFLMNSDLIPVVYQLLSTRNDEDQSLSSKAVDVFVSLALHGPDAWTRDDPSRHDILRAVGNTMKKWDKQKRAKMELTDVQKPFGRSLTAILSQIEHHNTPVLQVWASWKLYDFFNNLRKDQVCMLHLETAWRRIDSVLQHEGLSEDLVTVLANTQSLISGYQCARNIKIDNPS